MNKFEKLYIWFLFVAVPAIAFFTSLAIGNPAPIAIFPGTRNYPGASNYCWTVLSSTDLVTWQDEPFCVDTNGDYIVHANGRHQLFFRWKGTPINP